MTPDEFVTKLKAEEVALIYLNLDSLGCRESYRQLFHYGWGKSEAGERCNVLMPDEEIDECVNGFYEAGFALLVATKDRLLLIDKKPLNYLTVEDMRFDMICEFDYSHRLIGAEVTVASSGNKRSALRVGISRASAGCWASYSSASLKQNRANATRKHKKRIWSS